MGKIIDGTTQLLGIVGDPIAQVRAPEVWSALFRHNGVNAMCIPLHVAPADLGAFLKGVRAAKNCMGLIVTIPHKPAAVHHVDALTARAKLVQSVNVMRPEQDGSWTGDILDGLGFVQGLIRAGQRIAGRRALVVGSGGVGTAIAFAIAEAKAASVHVADIAQDRAAGLARRLEASGTPSGTSPAAARGFDLVVNASPVGMKTSDPISIDPGGLTPDALAGDVVVHPQITPWLAAAREAGCHVQPGTVMMDHQLAAMRDFFRLPEGDYSPVAVAKVMTG